MPELPEVETIRRILKNGGLQSPSLLNKKVSQAEVYWERTVAEPTPAEFKDSIQNQTIKDIDRRGKYLIIVLLDYFLLIHLRMSGDIIIEPLANNPGKHHRVTLELDGNIRFAFVDARKFGRIWLLKNPSSVLGTLGPEPLSPEFNAGVFYQRLHKKKRQIKPLLMDQKFLAGMGNIYTDEALHCAGINPKMKSDQISRQLSDRLWECIRKVLLAGIENNGSSIDWVYRGGDYQNYFNVYQRSGEPCLKCGQKIERIVVGQRGTHFCPVCQPPVNK